MLDRHFNQQYRRIQKHKNSPFFLSSYGSLIYSAEDPIVSSLLKRIARKTQAPTLVHSEKIQDSTFLRHNNFYIARDDPKVVHMLGTQWVEEDKRPPKRILFPYIRATVLKLTSWLFIFLTKNEYIFASFIRKNSRLVVGRIRACAPIVLLLYYIAWNKPLTSTSHSGLD